MNNNPPEDPIDSLAYDSIMESIIRVQGDISSQERLVTLSERLLVVMQAERMMNQSVPQIYIYEEGDDYEGPNYEGIN